MRVLSISNGWLLTGAICFVLGLQISGLQAARAQAGASTAASKAHQAIDLVPHTAEYTLKLIRAEQNANIQDVRGRFRYDITGNSCDGYTVEALLQNRIVDRSGTVTQLDQVSKSFEDPALSIFSFEETQKVNGEIVEITKGSAETVDGALNVRLASMLDPQSGLGHQGADAAKDGATGVEHQAARFPIQFMMDTIAAARAGDFFFYQRFYDGSDGGDVAYTTSGVISAPVDLADRVPDAFAKTQVPSDGWRVSLAYFKDGALTDKTDAMPDYQISFTLYENGVSSDLEIDYGDFVIRGEMVAFEALPASNCVQ